MQHHEDKLVCVVLPEGSVLTTPNRNVHSKSLLNMFKMEQASSVIVNKLQTTENIGSTANKFILRTTSQERLQR